MITLASQNLGASPTFIQLFLAEESKVFFKRLLLRRDLESNTLGYWEEVTTEWNKCSPMARSYCICLFTLLSFMVQNQLSELLCSQILVVLHLFSEYQELPPYKIVNSYVKSTRNLCSWGFLQKVSHNHGSRIPTHFEWTIPANNKAFLIVRKP